MENVLDHLNRLDIYSYEYNKATDYQKYLSKGIHYGFMAQELEEVYPRFTKQDDNGYYSVNDHELIPNLTKGIQEQQAQIETLEKEIMALKEAIGDSN